MTLYWLGMRLKAQFWIMAYLRTVMAGGAFATVVRHGDDDRGAILIKVNRLDGTSDLYVPASTALADDERADERVWTLGLTCGATDADVEARLASEARFDSDVWVIEVEDRQGRHFLEGSLLVPRA